MTLAGRPTLKKVFTRGGELILGMLRPKTASSSGANTPSARRIGMGLLLVGHGKILEMSDAYVAVVEIVSDGSADGWVERPRTIKLSGI